MVSSTKPKLVGANSFISSSNSSTPPKLMQTPVRINLLPPEILSHIFILYCQEGNNESKLPLQLGRVCKLWRVITLTTPDLWTHLHITFWPIQEPRVFSPLIPTIHQWLNRSGHLDCDIILATCNLEKGPMLAEILRPAVHRIRSLDLWIPLQELLDGVEVFHHGLPRLERLAVAFAGNDRRCGGLIKLPCNLSLPLQSCPRLVHLDLAEEFLNFVKRDDVVTMLPTHLKSLGIREALLSTVVRILHKCQQLEALDLQMLAWLDIEDPIPSSSIPPLSHSSLRVLDISYIGEHIPILFRRVQFPQLTELKLHQTSISISYGVLDALIADVVPPLERLELVHLTSCITPLDLLRFLERVPTIQKLLLDGCDCFNATFVQALTFSPERQSQYLPKLKYLQVSEYSPTLNVRETALLRMIESRWRVKVEGCEQIRFVKVYDERVVSEDHGRFLREMEKEGLFIDVVGFIPNRKEADHEESKRN